jgi:hypothetical protein
MLMYKDSQRIAWDEAVAAAPKPIQDEINDAMKSGDNYRAISLLDSWRTLPTAQGGGGMLPFGVKPSEIAKPTSLENIAARGEETRKTQAQVHEGKMEEGAQAQGAAMQRTQVTVAGAQARAELGAETKKDIEKSKEDAQRALEIMKETSASAKQEKDIAAKNELKRLDNHAKVVRQMITEKMKAITEAEKEPILAQNRDEMNKERKARYDASKAKIDRLRESIVNLTREAESTTSKISSYTNAPSSTSTNSPASSAKPVSGLQFDKEDVNKKLSGLTADQVNAWMEKASADPNTTKEKWQAILQSIKDAGFSLANTNTSNVRTNR